MQFTPLVLALTFSLGSRAEPVPVHDIVLSPDCTTTTILPTITLIQDGPNKKYEQCYTVTYDKWCSTGLCPHAYTVTETCDHAPCRGPTETALPPGFAEKDVVCSSCGPGGAPSTKALTFPTESADAFEKSGYHVNTDAKPTAPPTADHGSHDGHKEDDYPVEVAGGNNVLVNGILLGALLVGAAFI